jgi:putative transposase
MQKGPKPAELTLGEEERKGLEALIHRYSTPQQLAKRGRIVLASTEGRRNAEIARALAVRIDMVRTWRGRWISLQAVPLSELSITERLEDIPRPGKPPEITAEQLCQIVALACEAPSERPISHWTAKEIAQEIMQRGIVEHISPRHAARLLKKGISNPI